MSCLPRSVTLSRYLMKKSQRSQGMSYEKCHRGFGRRQPFLVEEIRPCYFQETPLPAVVEAMRTGVLVFAHVPALTTCKRDFISPHNKYGENMGGRPWNSKHMRGVHQHDHGSEGRRRES